MSQYDAAHTATKIRAQGAACAVRALTDPDWGPWSNPYQAERGRLWWAGYQTEVNARQLPSGPQLRALRRACGATLKTVAKVAGCELDVLSKVERGRGTVTADMWRGYLAIARWSGDEFTGSPQPHPDADEREGQRDR